MTQSVRYLVLMICLMSLVFAGPVSAACATDLGCVDSPTTAQTQSVGKADCDMGQNKGQPNKVQKCGHDACCGSHLVAISESTGVSTPPRLRAVTVASITKHLTASGWETLLDPPRA